MISCLEMCKKSFLRLKLTLCDVHTRCCSPLMCREGVNTLLCIARPHNLSCYFHFPVSSLFYLIVILYSNKARPAAASNDNNHLKKRSWSSSVAALVMSSALTNYQSWQVFMWCFAHWDTVYVCLPKALQRSTYHLHSSGLTFWLIPQCSNLHGRAVQSLHVFQDVMWQAFSFCLLRFELQHKSLSTCFL